MLDGQDGHGLTHGVQKSDYQDTAINTVEQRFRCWRSLSRAAVMTSNQPGLSTTGPGVLRCALQIWRPALTQPKPRGMPGP